MARVLDQLVALHGRPASLLMDNGPEFTGTALDRWAYNNQVRLQFIEPGRPVQNAYVESFNARLREECLNEHWFADVAEARRIIEQWRIDYNQRRPHSALKYRTPEEFARQIAGSHPLGGANREGIIRPNHTMDHEASNPKLS